MFNRRDFLKSFGLLGAGIAAPAAAIEAASTTIKGTRAGLVTIRGTVTSAGKGIAGVAVTDGASVVSTNSRGAYEIVSSNTAEFVYISVPAGYAFPAEKGVARFYQRIAATKGVFQANFSLDKLTVDDRKHNFVVWADPQIISEADATELKTTSAPDLKALVQAYPKDTLFHGIGCGDLVWDKFELYEDYKEAIAITGVPFFNVLGNHDMDLDAQGDEASDNTFKKEFGPTYYSFNRGAVHYVVLDDVFFVGTAKKYIGYISEAQLAWLEQDLALVKQGSTVVVSLHIPTNTGAARRNGKEEEMGGTVQNRRQLYKLLAPYNVHIMSGHTHVSESWTEGAITEHVHGTVCGAWWTGPICSDGTPSGYGVYEVNGSELQWYYKGTGLPRNEQLRVYARGRDKDNGEAVVANVWNWDPQWRVEWFEDGVAKGAMNQQVGLDPWAVELFAGPQLPQKHKFVEPTKTDHLFYAMPAAGAKEIMVKATDRFGNTYTAATILA
jgi:hypothetical protein